VNHPELKLPPLAKVRWLGGRIFWPEAGILVRLRSLGVGVASFIRVFWKPGRYKLSMRQNAGVSPRFAGTVLRQNASATRIHLPETPRRMVYWGADKSRAQSRAKPGRLWARSQAPTRTAAPQSLYQRSRGPRCLPVPPLQADSFGPLTVSL
jgi:hypothetical protein